jgi:hypothetical protein
LDGGKLEREIFDAFILEPDSSVNAFHGYFFAVFSDAGDQLVVAWPKDAELDHAKTMLIQGNGTIRMIDKPLQRISRPPDNWRKWNEVKME